MRRGLALAAWAVGAAWLTSAFAAEPFVGRWAVTAEACRGQGNTAQTAALIATDTSLSWFEGYCRIGKMYKAKAVYVQAHCGTKDVPVTLDAQGNRMRVTWDRKVEDMKRCN
jgi:hypothetical protein